MSVMFTVTPVMMMVPLDPAFASPDKSMVRMEDRAVSEFKTILSAKGEPDAVAASSFSTVLTRAIESPASMVIAPLIWMTSPVVSVPPVTLSTTAREPEIPAMNSVDVA